MTPIGFQDGIEAFYLWMKAYNSWAEAFEGWALGTRAGDPPLPPRIPGRSSRYVATDINTWPWRDKFRRTLQILSDDHDGADPGTPPTPTPTPAPPPQKKLAPQTYNRGGSGQDARYSIRENCTRVNVNRWQDGGAFQYDDSGLCLGGRSGQFIPGLKPADEMDGREPWEPYNGMPPWPAKSYEV